MTSSTDDGGDVLNSGSGGASKRIRGQHDRHAGVSTVTHQDNHSSIHRGVRGDILRVNVRRVTEVNDVLVAFDGEGDHARSAGCGVMDMDSGVRRVSRCGVSNGVHEDFVVRVMIGPHGGLTKQVRKGWIRRKGHCDGIISSADAVAKVNKTILVESSLDRQGEDCELEKWRNLVVDFSFSIAVRMLVGVGFSTGGTEE